MHYIGNRRRSQTDCDATGGGYEQTLADFKGPLADRYWAAVALVLLALTPFLVLTSAVSALSEEIGKAVGLSEAGMEMTAGMADAAYCFGTVLAVQLTQRLPARRMLVVFSSLFVSASLLAAWAPTPGLFVTGRVLQGLATSLMLIAAAPPLVIGWPTKRLRPTAVTMNLGIFGAVALGPTVGGLFAEAESWRTLFWIVAGLGVGALAFILLTYEDQPPQDTEAPVDLISLALASSGSALAFFGASELVAHSLMSAIVLLPMLVGVALLLALLLHQFFVRDPLMPVKQLAHTIPVAAILTAMCAGAASVAAIGLAGSALELQKVPPGHAGALFLPEFGAAIATAILFGAIFFTRWTPVMALGGLLFLGGGAAVLSGAANGSDALFLVGTGLVGLGVGSSVSPALFVTGFSLASGQLPRIFALVELLRGAAAFLAAPLLLHMAETVGSTPAAGIEPAMLVAMGIALGGAVAAVGIFTAGGARLQRPDVETWLAKEGPAIHSPALGGDGRAPADTAPARS
jgi:MFS family permease